MTEKVIGRCSICGGDVVMPTSYLSVVPPKPYCRSCGAVRKSNLPVIPMERPNTGKWGDRKNSWGDWDSGREPWEYKANKDTPKYDQYFGPYGDGVPFGQ